MTDDANHRFIGGYTWNLRTRFPYYVIAVLKVVSRKCPETFIKNKKENNQKKKSIHKTQLENQKTKPNIATYVLLQWIFLSISPSTPRENV